MARTRKRTSEDKSLRASNEQKKLKPSDPLFTEFSVSSGGSGSDTEQLGKETINNGENGRVGETKLDSGLGNGNCIIIEGSSETLEGDQSTVEKAIDDLEENPVETDSLTEQNCTPRQTGLRKTENEDKGASEENPKKSQSTIQSQNQQSKSYTCVCGKSYTRRSHLHRHQKTHVGDDKAGSGHHDGGPCEVKMTSEKSFPCICGKSYTISSHLYRHQKTCQAGGMTNLAEESPLKPYVCNCGKRYTSSSHLYRHQRSHLDQNKESSTTYICDCGKMFSCRSHLNLHQRTHTQKNDQVEEHGGDSVEDTETEATGRIKPYVCLCGKSYTSSSHLYRHQRTHQEGNISTSARNRAEDSKMEKPYKCECGKSYTSTSHLYRHQRTHKTQEVLVDDLDCDSDVHYEEPEAKPYQCECGKSFILWFSLMVHKRVHCKAKLQSPSASKEKCS